MATAQRFELGLLPERKLDWRTFVTSYGFVALMVVIVVNISLIWPERLQLHNYHVTELIPLPSVQPKPIEIRKPPPLRAKLLPPAPVFDAPKLVVPREIREVAHSAPRSGSSENCNRALLRLPLSKSCPVVRAWLRSFAPGNLAVRLRLR